MLEIILWLLKVSDNVLNIRLNDSFGIGVVKLFFTAQQLSWI
jgi:hypothetical protein